MRILVIEDDPALRAAVVAVLERAGMAVDAAGNADDAAWLQRQASYTVVVCDVGLPGRSGLELLARWRADGLGVPVLLLTARDTVEDRVAGLDAGADDYLIKPFAVAELLARVRALARRQAAGGTPLVTVGDLTVDTVACTVTRAGVRLDLAPKEYRLLEYLARQAGRVVPRDELEGQLYALEDSATSNVLEALVARVRRKLALPGLPDPVQTRRGLGYGLQVGP